MLQCRRADHAAAEGLPSRVPRAHWRSLGAPVRVPSQLGQHPGVSEEEIEEESEGESSNQHLGYRHLLFCEEERASWSRIHLVPLPSLNDNTLRILSRLDCSVWQRANELGRGVRLFRVVHLCGFGVGKRYN